MTEPDVQCLASSDSEPFIRRIVQEYRLMLFSYGLENTDIFLIDATDSKEVLAEIDKVYASKHQDVTSGKTVYFIDTVVLPALNQGVTCSNALKHGLVEKVLHMSKTYAGYKTTPQSERQDRVMLLKQIFQSYADIISDVAKFPLRSKMILACVLNIIVKNGFFEFLHNGANSKIKVIRNIREHNNVITDAVTWTALMPLIASVINEHMTLKLVQELVTEIDSGRRIILFDRNDKGNVSFVLSEDPSFFLRKLITLCHVQMFLLGLNDRIILSQQLYESYWAKKYGFTFNLETISVAEHQERLSQARDTLSKGIGFEIPKL